MCFRNAWDNFLIALIIWHICIVCTVIPARFQPYTPVQIVHSPPPVVKVQARVNSFKKQEH